MNVLKLDELTSLPPLLQNQRTDPQEMLFLLDQSLPACSAVGTDVLRYSSLSFLSVGGIPGPGCVFLNWHILQILLFSIWITA